MDRGLEQQRRILVVASMYERLVEVARKKTLTAEQLAIVYIREGLNRAEAERRARKGGR